MIKKYLNYLQSDQTEPTLQDNEVQSFSPNLRLGTIVYIARVKVIDTPKTYKVSPK